MKHRTSLGAGQGVIALGIKRCSKWDGPMDGNDIRLLQQTKVIACRMDGYAALAFYELPVDRSPRLETDTVGWITVDRSSLFPYLEFGGPPAVTFDQPAFEQRQELLDSQQYDIFRRTQQRTYQRDMTTPDFACAFECSMVVEVDGLPPQADVMQMVGWAVSQGLVDPLDLGMHRDLEEPDDDPDLNRPADLPPSLPAW